MITKLRAVNTQVLTEAALCLHKGGLVAFPTETVYGLGANALNPTAVAKIFEVKGRPADNPLIVHVATRAQVEVVAKEITPLMEKLMQNFWPGPLSLIMKCRDVVPKIVTAGLKTVAVRMPSHPVALALIRKADMPIAAPSANISGLPSGTLAEHVWRDFNGKVEYILDGGPCRVGLESTVLDCTTDPPVILRPGAVTLEALQQIEPRIYLDVATPQQKPRAPGMKYTHYTPAAKVVLIEGHSIEELRNRLKSLLKDEVKTAIIGVWEVVNDIKADKVLAVGRWADPTEFAEHIYDFFRACDQAKIDRILVHGVPEQGLGLAIMNRLRKAANVIYKGEDEC